MSSSSVDFSDCDVVLFDMETTGLAVRAETIQVAACGKYVDSSFNTYMIPPRGIPKETTKINGFTYENGYLFQNENCYEPVRARVGFKEFIKYLDSFDNQVILVAHNAFGFDRKRIRNLAYRLYLYPKFANLIAGFADTLPMIRDWLPKRRRQWKCLKPFSLPILAKDYLPDVDLSRLHNAEYDVQILDKLLDKLGIDENTIKNYAQPL